MASPLHDNLVTGAMLLVAAMVMLWLFRNLR